MEIWKHQLVPQHILLTPEEIQKLFEEYNITFDNLPKIKVHDPAIKHLNAKPGDVVKIIRKSKIAGECEYYRGVVE
ncbi:MAG: DNA-directed RNA polymerase subunit H [Candidatus Woesearchaeota archaeon]